MTDTANGRPLRDLQKMRFAPAKQRDQLRGVQRLTRAKILFVSELRKAVPRADQLAVIAAVDAVANQRPEFGRNRSLQLNRQVGDAASGINGIGLNNGPGRTDRHAGHALSAVLLDRFVDR